MSTEQSIMEQYPEYEATIGIEVHAQLITKSKIFCLCPNEAVAEPNSLICQICCGHPGVLPVLNKQVVDYGIMAGIATNCTIASSCTFDRKHYFYPDLPKSYQITQQYEPICIDGHVPIRLADGSIKNIRLKRIHIEEDAGKNLHVPDAGKSLVDFNRAGTPLLEIVTEPDINSSYEARAYLKTLRTTVQYLRICSGNMEEGAFRADTNISVRKKGAKELGTRCELKNISAFNYGSDAIEYELARQITLLEDGEKVRQETRLWDSKNKKTVIMRSKEEAADYRFFEDPDLPQLEINDEWIDRVRASLPELPHEKFERLCAEDGLTPYEAAIIVEDPALASYFEQAYKHSGSKKLISWVLRNVMGYLKEHKLAIADLKVGPKQLARIVALLEEGTINNHAAQEIFEEIAETGADPDELVKEKGLEQVSSEDELSNILDEIFAANAQQVADYKGGNERILPFFVGQVMKKTQGKANPKVVQELLKKKLG